MKTAKMLCANFAAFLFLTGGFALGAIGGWSVGFLYGIGRALSLGLPLMLAWNVGLSSSFGTLTLLQAVCLCLVSRVLIKGEL